MSRLVNAIDYGPIMAGSNAEHAVLADFRRRHPDYDKLPDAALVQWIRSRKEVPTEDEVEAGELTAFNTTGSAYRTPATMSDDL